MLLSGYFSVSEAAYECGFSEPRYFNAVFKKYDIGRAVWSYKEMDFGLIDAHYDDVRSDIIDLL